MKDAALMIVMTILLLAMATYAAVAAPCLCN